MIFMASRVAIEIVGFRDTACGPFPCDETRSCGLAACHPEGTLPAACEALQESLAEEFGDRISLTLTFLEEGMPEHVREIIEERSPPLPMLLVNGRLTPIGRISVPLLKKEVEKALSA